jgi:PAS domain S-box-containing protein
MLINLNLLWLLHAVALVLYSVLLIYLLMNRRWQDPTELRLDLYLGVAFLGAFAFTASHGNWAFPEIRTALLKFNFYTQAALPLFYFALARTYIRLERQPWIYGSGVVILLALFFADVFQLSLNMAGQIIPTFPIVLLLRALAWLVCNGSIFWIAMQEYLHQSSPLHRNRLVYLAVASFFLYSDGVLNMLGTETTLSWAIGFQITGLLVLAYATLHHVLVDLRTLIRRVAYFIIITTFTALVYFFAFESVISYLRGADPSRGIIGALIAAMALAFVYQPIHNLVQRLIEKSLFGQRYDVQRIVSQFSQHLSERNELEELAQEGRRLLQQTMRARDAHLLIFERDKEGCILAPIPAQDDLPAIIRLAPDSSVVQALTVRNEPLLQYDLDRLPPYRDLAPEIRAQLRKLRTEVYLPVKQRGELIGVWIVGAKVSGDRYSDEDLALLTTLAGQSAVALENARLIADLRHQMSELRSMRDYLDSTMASISTGVLTLDRAGKVISFNRAAEGIFRVPAVNAIGKPYEAVLPNLEGAQFPLLLSRIWSQSAQHLVRDVVTQVNGRGQVHLTLHLSPMWHSDQIVGVAVVVEDLTEQARLEQERREEEKEKQRIRETFEHYVAPAVVQELLANPNRIQLGGEQQLVTLLFADIHGFSSLSESLPPEELVDVLNGYLAIAYRCILQYEGTVDKYMGDGMMAIFNAPIPQCDHALRAASAALAIHREVEKYAHQLPRSQRLNFRIGLHTGEAIVGNIGTEDLMNYTAVGDTVNVAKRLQENAEPGQTLMSRNTFALIEERVIISKSQVITIKGRTAPVEVFDLCDLRTHSGVSLK